MVQPFNIPSFRSGNRLRKNVFKHSGIKQIEIIFINKFIYMNVEILF